MGIAQGIQLRVLGPLEARRAGRPVAVPGAKPRSLLTVLALNAGQVLPAPYLQAVLWGDETPRTAHKALQTHISALRRVLGETALITRGAGWLLSVEATDAGEFQRAARAGREATDLGDMAGAVAHFTAGLRMWRGSLELPATPRAQAEITRWDEAHDSVVDDRTDALLACGQAAELVGDLESAVAEAPLRERRWAQLCLALYRAGRQADALAAYQRARVVLADELGVEPGPELRRLEAAILAQDATLDVPAVRTLLTRGAQAEVVEAGTNPSDGATVPASVGASKAETDRSDGSPAEVDTEEVATDGVPGGHEPVTAHGDDADEPASIVAGVPSTTFVGRGAELEQIDRLLAAHRLVTVVGPGGVGKTRLAVAAADAASVPFPAGVHFVDLAACERLLPEAVAAAIGIVERPGRPLERAVYEFLGTRRSLLILDNCERLVGEAGSFAERLVAACPHVVVLVTSRERLGVPGEQVLRVPPLSMVAPGTGGPKGSDAETLFLDRARAVEPEFDADPQLIADVCARCDGLPLAIELAAARCGSLGIDGLLTGLDDRLRLLVGGRGTAGRHRSLRTVLDWSHDLLDPDEQTAFRRIGVFAGSADLPALAAVIGDQSVPEQRTGSSPAAVSTVGSASASGHHTAGGCGSAGRSALADAADVVGRLTDKNLLSHEASSVGSRWRMLDVVRSYARDRLGASGDAPAAWGRYLRWARSTAVDLERRLDTGVAWRDDFDAVAVDLHSALTSTGGPPGGPLVTTPDGESGNPDRLHLALALARLEARRGAFTLAQTAYEEVVSMARAAGDAEQLAQAALGASMAGMLFGVTQSGRVSLLEEALAAYGTEPTATRARLLARLGTELYWAPDRSRSLALADEAQEVAEKLGDDSARAHALYARYYVTRGPGPGQARLLLAEQIMTLSRRAGESQLELAGLAAHVVGNLEAGNIVAAESDIAALREGADGLHYPEFRWYAAVYQLVLALLAGRYGEADQLAADAAVSGQQAPEFPVDLFFAMAVTDLRQLTGIALRQRRSRLTEMARRFPRVVVWQCLGLLDDIAADRRIGTGEQTASLVDEVLDQPRDGHWLVACCLLAEAAAALRQQELSVRLADALAPYREDLAVAGRVAAFRGSVAHALGVLALAAGDVEQAVETLEVAVEHHRRMGAQPFLARSLGALADAYGVRAADGDRTRAAAIRRQLTNH